MKFTKNVGSTDRMIRIGLGVALLILAVLGYVGWFAYIIGAVLLATGISRVCPSYDLVGMNTINGDQA